MEKHFALGFDIGGFKIRGVVASSRGKIVAAREVRFVRRLRNKRDFLATFFPLCDFLLKQERVKDIGIGVASVVANNKPITFRNIPYLRGINFAKLLKERYRLTTRIENDVKVAALAEHRFGAGKQSPYMVMLTLGTGIGCGVVIHGKLFEGAFDSAYEIGSMVTKVDRREIEFESLASAKFFLRQNLDPFQEEVRARHGDLRSKKHWYTFGNHLGIGLANIVNLMEPERIVIGGGLSHAWSLFAPHAMQTMRRLTFSPIARYKTRVFRTKLGRDATALGAALLILGARK